MHMAPGPALLVLTLWPCEEVQPGSQLQADSHMAMHGRSYMLQKSGSRHSHTPSHFILATMHAALLRAHENTNMRHIKYT